MNRDVRAAAGVMLFLGLACLPSVARADVPGARRRRPAAIRTPIRRPPATPRSRLSRVLGGEVYPLTLRLKQLNSRWRRLAIRPGLDPTQYSPLLSTVLGDYTKYISVYYTRGQTERIGSRTFLVAYHAQITRPLYLSPTVGPITPEGQRKIAASLKTVRPLTPETVLRLSLVNLRNSGNLLDISPFDLKTEIAEVNRPSADVVGVFVTARGKAANFASVSSLKQLGTATLLYAQDHDDRLPPLTSTAVAKAALLQYVRAEAVFVHPVTHAAYVPNGNLSGASLAQMPDSHSDIVYYEASPGEDGTRAVLYADGHVKRVDAATWKKVSASTKRKR